MPEKELGQLEVEFPEDVDEELALQFEKIFVSYGFLKTGLVSDADEYVLPLLSRYTAQIGTTKHP